MDCMKRATFSSQLFYSTDSSRKVTFLNCVLKTSETRNYCENDRFRVRNTATIKNSSACSYNKNTFLKLASMHVQTYIWFPVNNQYTCFIPVVFLYKI